MKVNIPNPCTENYDSMSPTELGRLCNVCNTEVVDFSNWETKDIVDYIQKSNQKVCGKLNSSKTAKKEFKIKRWSKYVAALLAFGSLGTFSYAKESSNKPSYSTISSNLVDSVSVHIVDKKNNPLQNILLTNKSNNQKFHTDETGYVKLPITGDEVYTITYIGYDKQEIKINNENPNITLKVLLDDEPTIIDKEIIIEPLERIKPTFNTEIKINPKNRNSITTIILKESDNTIGEVVIKTSVPIRKRIKKLLNIFSIRDDN